MFDRVGCSTTTADFLDVDAIECRDIAVEVLAGLGGRDSRLPPQRPGLLQHRLGQLPTVSVFRDVGIFFVASLNDNARPFVMAQNFIGFHTYQRI